MRILAIYAFTHRILLYIISNEFDLDCPFTPKGKLFPSLKRWREVVDNDRGFKGKSGISIKIIMYIMFFAQQFILLPWI